MHIVKIISFLATFSLPISANATPDEMACDIIEAAINYRFEQDGGRGVCGTDSVTNKRLCLRKPSDRFFVSGDTFKLKKPIEASAPKLVPAIKLPDSVKKQVESKSREVSMSRLILESRKKVEQEKIMKNKLKFSLYFNDGMFKRQGVAFDKFECGLEKKPMKCCLFCFFIVVFSF